MQVVIHIVEYAVAKICEDFLLPTLGICRVSQN